MRTLLWRVKTASAGRRGFTAIEIAMVATVIAIFALIVLPLFRNRVEEAKIAAAKADLASFMKAEQLAKADTGYYFRLEDLDNLANNDPTLLPKVGITIETPPLVYYEEGGTRELRDNPPSLAEPQWHNLSGTVRSDSKREPKFKGPYATLNRTITYGELRRNAGFLPMIRSLNGNTYCAIRDLRRGNLPPNSNKDLYDAEDNRIPVDPWGNPYLFFPPSGETIYNYASIISMGPDGSPGDGTGQLVTLTYVREGGKLGKGDDLEVRF